MDIREVPIVVTRADYERLSTLAEATARAPRVRDYLAAELERARVVADDQVAATVVTMHSRFVFRDDSTGDVRTVSLVYPGAALLGLSEGQSIEWETRIGESRTLTVLRLLSQPSPHPAS
jgi:regulator of nucleoside diphosphate kinase